MPGMCTAVDRILSASKNHETVLVHGDYDVDGISATAILLRALKKIGIDCRYFIPNRMEHGYGFKPLAVQKAKEMGATLLITVDCGISSFDAASCCRQEGIDVIITDHHEPLSSRQPVVSSEESRDRTGDCQHSPADFLLPDALAVINPKLSTQNPRLSVLSGAGVALKVVHALSIKLDSRLSIQEVLDLAALGTLGDVVPLTEENRVIVREGLKEMENSSQPGIQALRWVSRTEGRELKTGLILFTLIPRINAAGRIADPNTVIKLFLTDSADEAAELAQWLNSLNSERQDIEEVVYQQALDILRSRGISPVIVLASEGWHRGVIGIVASRIAEKFCRPVCIFSKEGTLARGSARSIPSFDIYQALTHCSPFLMHFGGHRQAAGMELNAEAIPMFERCINRFAEETLSDEDYVPNLAIDADVSLADIGFPLTRELAMLEPFGCGNPEPLLGARGLEVLYPRILKNSHLKMRLRQNNRSLDAIGFDMAAFFEKLEDSPVIDAAFIPKVNEWEGVKSLQLNLRALRPSQ
jgi:single-stranded-DNA-specific exonuclease